MLELLIIAARAGDGHDSVLCGSGLRGTDNNEALIDGRADIVVNHYSHESENITDDLTFVELEALIDIVGGLGLLGVKNPVAATLGVKEISTLDLINETVGPILNNHLLVLGGHVPDKLLQLVMELSHLGLVELDISRGGVLVKEAVLKEAFGVDYNVHEH